MLTGELLYRGQRCLKAGTKISVVFHVKNNSRWRQELEIFYFPLPDNSPLWEVVCPILFPLTKLNKDREQKPLLASRDWRQRKSSCLIASDGLMSPQGEFHCTFVGLVTIKLISVQNWTFGEKRQRKHFWLLKSEESIKKSHKKEPPQTVYLRSPTKIGTYWGQKCCCHPEKTSQLQMTLSQTHENGDCLPL